MAVQSIDLLTFKEKISENLSSVQIVRILNALINAATEPLFKHSHLMRQLILQALIQTQTDHRRKISIHSKQVTASCIVYGVSQNNYSAIKTCELDRYILLRSISYIQPYLERALIAEKKLVKRPESKKWLLELKELQRITGIPQNLLTPLAKWCLPYLSLYLQFKERIIAKYIKMAKQQANKSKENTKLYVDAEELFKNYILAIDKAIDKFDANQGTLTSYILRWILSARSAPEFDHQYGVSYKIPANIRKEYENSGKQLTNMSSSIDDTHLEIEDEQVLDDMKNISSRDKLFVSCLREITGIKFVYLMLDIPIQLADSEVKNFKGLR